MHRYRVTALQPVTISVTLVDSETPQRLSLKMGETCDQIKVLHEVAAIDGVSRIDDVPHPRCTALTLVLGSLIELRPQA